jgi:hypothetical protein
MIPISSYVIYFQQHLGFQPISPFVLLNISGYPGSATNRSFVFMNIPGYPFIFDVHFGPNAERDHVLLSTLFSVA